MLDKMNTLFSIDKAKEVWIKESGAWYYLSTSGEKQKEWLNRGGIWHYLSEEDGDIQTRLQDIDGKIYYFNDSGVMFNKGWKKIMKHIIISIQVEQQK